MRLKIREEYWNAFATSLLEIGAIDSDVISDTALSDNEIGSVENWCNKNNLEKKTEYRKSPTSTLELHDITRTNNLVPVKTCNRT